MTLSLADKFLLELANRADPDGQVLAEFVPPTLEQFVKLAWPIIDKQPLVWGWSMGAVCEHLTAVTNREIRRLIINIPPRQSKSRLTCVLWPAWTWIEQPEHSWLFGSYSWNFAKRDAVLTRRLINSQWYQASYGHVYGWSSDQNEKMRYDNDRGGYRISTSVGGSALGDGADTRVIDDPLKPDDAESDIKREDVNNWWKNTWSTRINDPQTDAEVIIMQRLHERDLSGFILSEMGGYEHLMLPMRFEPERKCFTSIGFADPRKDEGELLNPDRFGETAVSELEHKLSASASGQLQQNPTPATGEIFKKYWWWFWVPEGIINPEPVMVKDEEGNWQQCPIITLPSRFDEYIQSWDMSFKETKDTSFVVGQVWAALSQRYFLLDQARDRMDFTTAKQAVIDMSERWPQAVAKLIEDKANGPAIMNSLRTDLHGLLPVQPYGNKIARARAISPLCESGNVVLPHPQVAPWVRLLIDELAKFPKGANDDQVDSLSQALARWAVKGKYTWAAP